VTKKVKQFITLRVNGEEHEVAVSPNRTLLEVLREDLGLTGTKEGCDDGVCGTCTVLVNGKPLRACLLLAIQAQGSRITTIEGLAEGERLHPIQQAFIDHGAIQCGYCTPGMILAAKALLEETAQPTDHQIKRAISGNFCRCTGYNKIVEAIGSVARMKGGR
jgi:aerobic carbon-monoxide dehydrogenase small subunit